MLHDSELAFACHVRDSRCISWFTASRDSGWSLGRGAIPYGGMRQRHNRQRMKWYHDSKTGTCKRFVYGGCQGNGNRFDSESECKQHCKSETSGSPSSNKPSE
ncbi:BPTI/Kunitz domain-containing protein [Nocardia sp. NBC_01499]|uniref:BPTI/Kunitz domain-containing protein n=1 Tax=Nocardia sp. NBC_01499 TaxID=2903597 RepID=UPI0038700245